MGTESQENSATPCLDGGPREIWPWVTQALQAGEYDLIAAWLLAMEETFAAGTPARAIMTAVVQLCRVCQEQQRESEATRAIYQRLVWQEKVLTEGLSGLLEALLTFPLESVDHFQGGQRVGEIRPFPFPPTVHSPPPGLWQKLQGMVGRLAGNEPVRPPEKPPPLPDKAPFMVTLSSPPLPEEPEEETAPESARPGATEEQSTPFSPADRALLHDIVNLLHTQNQLLLVAATAEPPAPSETPQPDEDSQPAAHAAAPDDDANLPEQGAAASYDLAQRTGTPCLTIYTLGAFRVYQDDQLVDDMTSSKSWSIFKYLLVNRKKPVPKEVLMDMYWPEAAPDAARNNLNVAIYHLRKTLRDDYSEFSHILYQDDHYLLNPEMVVWVDAEDFVKKYRQAQSYEEDGRFSQAIQLYHAAESVYQGEFLAEDRYEDWPLFLRQRYQTMYLKLLQRLSAYYYIQGDYNLSIRFSRLILLVDPCDEEAHQQIMRGYYQLGQHYLALRQYHQCAETLEKELAASPTPETNQLVCKIRSHEKI